MIHGLPFLTLPDPATEGEGVLDPLGLSVIGDRLAEEILPGLRARMSRPRFLTAIAVCATVCDGLEDEVAADRVTPAYIVFEWLLVEGFVRAGAKEHTSGTPGTLKGQAAKNSGQRLCARTYLRVPSIFGFHGVYKPLARHLGIIDDDYRLSDNGFALVKTWQAEQRLEGFASDAVNAGEGTRVRQLLRSGVEDGLRQACIHRSPTWQGWHLLAKHLSPALLGRREASLIDKLIKDDRGGPRREVFQLLEGAPKGHLTESDLIVKWLIPRASEGLKRGLAAIAAFEGVCVLLERAFDSLRYLSTKAATRGIDAKDFCASPLARDISGKLQDALRQGEDAISRAALIDVQQNFARLTSAFDHVASPGDLFEALLKRHTQVQKSKKPDGKRDWFERAPKSKTFIRVPYRLNREPEERDGWSRPYRISTARSFLSDIRAGHATS